jgi:ubiquinone/menaquinone biosynthesis C-methylase UbiE
MKVFLISTVNVLLCVVGSSAFVIQGPNSAPRSLHKLDVFKPLTQLPPPSPVDLVKPVATESISRIATAYKSWGVEGEQYWFDERIHTLGNTGFWGAVHAACAPISTKIIDSVAYKGLDIRAKVAEELRKVVNKKQPRIVDLCCGVGISTRALRDAFHDAQEVIGIDTSPEMVSMAGFLSNHLSVVKSFLQPFTKAFSSASRAVKDQGRMIRHKLYTKSGLRKPAVFIQANAEDTNLPDRTFDLVTVMYAFHEAPREGRERILREARRLLQPGGTLAIVDISTDYQPSETMLRGEPYVLKYQEEIHQQLRGFSGFFTQEYQDLVEGHVGMWIMRRTPAVV